MTREEIVKRAVSKKLGNLHFALHFNAHNALASVSGDTRMKKCDM